MTFGARWLGQKVLDQAASGDGYLIGQVTAVASSAGSAPATVRVAGADLVLPRLASYTPAEGDVVLLVRAAGTWVNLGRLTGFPT